MENLCSTLSFAYAFEFEQATNPVSFEDYLELSDGGSVVFKADEVILFSGGLDSLSGAIEVLSTNGKHVALVSHRSSSKIFDHQKHLVARERRLKPICVHAGSFFRCRPPSAFMPH